MQVIIVAFAAVVLGVGILANSSDDNPNYLPAEKTTVEEDTVLGMYAVPSPTATPSATVAPTPTSTSAPTVEPVQQVTISTTNSSLSDFIYPNANVISSSASRLELSTSVDPGTVTDWYRAKMKEKNFNVTSAVKTTTNGVVNNQLAGANGSYGVEISINKSSASSVSTIKVNLTN